MSVLHIIPPDATPGTHFDCEWGPWPTCSLAYRACLARQSAMRRAPGRGHRKSPMYPTCHDECTVGRTVAARFGTTTGTVHSPTAFGVMQVYRPALPAKEEKMAICAVKGCGRALRSDNKKGLCARCSSRRLKPGDELPAPGPTPRRVRAFDPARLSNEDLAACVREARERRVRIQREAEQQVRELDAALTGGPAAGGDAP